MHSFSSIIVIGSGAFGVSAATCIRDRFPDVKLEILSTSQPGAPSNDYSKIIRGDYAQRARSEEARNAQHSWRSHADLQRFYHETGRVVRYVGDVNQQTILMINETRVAMGLERRVFSKHEDIPPPYRFRAEPGPDVTVFNEDDGMVDWAEYMDFRRKTLQPYTRDVLVKRLQHELGRITKIECANGECIDAQNKVVILAGGPWIPQLLKESQIQQPGPERQIIATGIFAFPVILGDEDREALRNCPAYSEIGYGS